MAPDILAQARSACELEHWSEAARLLHAADAAGRLGPDDLDRLATAAHLVGDDAGNIEARTRAYQGHSERGDTVKAARSAFWLAFTILDRPDQQAQAGGWLARARRLLDECGKDCVEHGFMRCAEAYQHVGRGELAAAAAAFGEASRIGAHHHDADLLALARHGEGRLLLRSGNAGDGMATLDEVMVSVTTGEVGPLVTGLVYCSVISACHDEFDLRRAREWTWALSDWCASHPDIVPFRGACQIRRSEILRLEGAWTEALDEARRACEQLNRPGDARELGLAWYEWAEIQRLRGEFEGAEMGYRRALQAGRTPQPGLALLRLSQGDAAAAVAAIRHTLDEVSRQPLRTQALRAAIDVLLAGSCAPEAARAADELETVAAASGASYLRASAATARGAVRLDIGDARGALPCLHEGCILWKELGATYDVARTTELVGLAYQAAGDEEGAQLQFDAAAALFDQLGAAPDLARVTGRSTRSSPGSPLLTGRELEVLRLVASGRSNRNIAAALNISEKTVARHISNIFNKLDLPSRSAATAYAYRHKLV